MVRKKSIIDRVVDEQRQKKQEELERKHQQKDEIEIRQANIHSYINNVLGKLQHFKPMYNPRGIWLGKARWTVSSTSSSLEAKATISFSKTVCFLKSFYESDLRLKNMNQLFSQYTDFVNQNPHPILVCVNLMTDTIVDAEVLNLFRNYDHYGFVPFLFQLNTHSLSYNQDNWKATFFARWFDPQQKPVQMIELLDEITDNHDVFTVDDVKQKFHFDEKEVKAMLSDLVNQHQIMHLKADEYSVIK